MKWIFLSPHLDDIAFSCGGLVSDLDRNGQEVEIWNICAGDPPEGELSPFARELHGHWELGRNAVRIRREEDQRACQAMGAVPRYFPIPDCIYRKTSGGDYYYTSAGEIFGGLDPGEADLIAGISAMLGDGIPRNARVVSPLGIGNHVDHELVRKAVTRLDIPLDFYADFPYAREDQGLDILSFMEKSGEWHYDQIPISEEGLGSWVKASGAYRSQISTFWADEFDLGQQIREFSSLWGGIRLWKAVEED